MAGVGGDPALNELQIGAAAWAVTLAMFGAQGIVSIMLEGRQLVVGTIGPRLTNPLSAAIAALSVAVVHPGWSHRTGHRVGPANGRRRYRRWRGVPRPRTLIALLQGGLYWP